MGLKAAQTRFLFTTINALTPNYCLPFRPVKTEDLDWRVILQAAIIVLAAESLTVSQSRTQEHLLRQEDSSHRGQYRKYQGFTIGLPSYSLVVDIQNRTEGALWAHA
jgi:hypothetical protein